MHERGVAIEHRLGLLVRAFRRITPGGPRRRPRRRRAARLGVREERASFGVVDTSVVAALGQERRHARAVGRERHLFVLGERGEDQVETLLEPEGVRHGVPLLPREHELQPVEQRLAHRAVVQGEKLFAQLGVPRAQAEQVVALNLLEHLLAQRRRRRVRSRVRLGVPLERAQRVKRPEELLLPLRGLRHLAPEPSQVRELGQEQNRLLHRERTGTVRLGERRRRFRLFRVLRLLRLDILLLLNVVRAVLRVVRAVLRLSVVLVLVASSLLGGSLLARRLRAGALLPAARAGALLPSARLRRRRLLLLLLRLFPLRVRLHGVAVRAARRLLRVRGLAF